MTAPGRLPDCPYPNYTESLATVADEIWDAIVVGAGPAGSMAARQLSRRGHRTLLVDADQLPREKVCGDALLPDALVLLDSLGLLDMVSRLGHRTGPIQLFSPSRIAVDLPVTLLTVRRRELDAALAWSALVQGAHLVVGRVDHIEYEASGNVVARFKGQSHTVRARAAILAVGAQIDLLRRCGMLLRSSASAVAYRGYVHTTQTITRPTVTYERSLLPGYGWLFPMADGECNVGVGVFGAGPKAHAAPLQSRLADLAGSFGVSGEGSATGGFLSAPRGARLRCGLHGARVFDGRRVLAAGEAIGTTYAFTGEGIGQAMASGLAAAECVSEALERADFARLAGFEQQLRVSRKLHKGYQLAERWLSHSWLGDMLARLARRNQRLRLRLGGILGESVDPREVFSLRGLITAMVE